MPVELEPAVCLHVPDMLYLRSGRKFMTLALRNLPYAKQGRQPTYLPGNLVLLYKSNVIESLLNLLVANSSLLSSLNIKALQLNRAEDSKELQAFLDPEDEKIVENSVFNTNLVLDENWILDTVLEAHLDSSTAQNGQSDANGKD